MANYPFWCNWKPNYPKKLSKNLSKNISKNLSKNYVKKSVKKSFKKIWQKICQKIFQKICQNPSKNLLKNMSKFMNLLKFFSDYHFLNHRLPQKGNLPQVKKHCSILYNQRFFEWRLSSEIWVGKDFLEAIFDLNFDKKIYGQQQFYLSSFTMMTRLWRILPIFLPVSNLSPGWDWMSSYRNF